MVLFQHQYQKNLGPDMKDGAMLEIDEQQDGYDIRC